jgi:hypothetical protein
VTDSVGRLQATRIDYAQVKRDAWRKDRILVVEVDKAAGLSWADRELLRAIGDQLYGRRKRPE